ncbi:MAG: putative membrane protein YfcA [Planctomycetota bacterium]|jgi:uncharacterized membrane protein YfcA
MSPSTESVDPECAVTPDVDAPPATPEARSIQGFGIALMGMVIATWGAMCGIGGGLFAVPLLHFVYKLKLKEAIVISLGLVAATTASATLSEAFRTDTAIHWGVVGCLVIGALVGTQIGFRVAKRIETRRLKQIFVVVLVFVGFRILGLGPETVASQLEASELAPIDFLKAAAIGLGGGFVSPLLGIGGGLVAVPALLIFLPSLGHLGARACSMAMSVFTSTRSMVLYYQAGDLDLRRAMSFGIGAAIGAFIGVQLVHIPGVAEVAKTMLAGTLLVVAFRFALDLRHKPESD